MTAGGEVGTKEMCGLHRGCPKIHAWFSAEHTCSWRATACLGSDWWDADGRGVYGSRIGP